MKLSYAVALSDCKAKKMRCFRGDLDAMCAQIKALGYVMASSCLRAIRTVQALLDTLWPHRFTAIGRIDRMGLRN